MLDPHLAQNVAENLPTPDQIETAGVQVTERDIVFECPHCQGELVIDMDGALMQVNCAHCDHLLTVPEYHGPSLEFLRAATAKLAKAIQAARSASPKSFHFSEDSMEDLKRRQTELQRAIRENQAQAGEVKGHIHHATIQLHRYQLKMEVLEERQAELKAELDALLEALKAKQG